jgi:hypothetical protein
MSELEKAARQALDALGRCSIRLNDLDFRESVLSAIDSLRAALAQQAEPVPAPPKSFRVGYMSGYADGQRELREKQQAEPVDLTSEWQACTKLPVTVHVRSQKPGEKHISTREGITPIEPDDLIMRGVQGEEYPIGREIFSRTYRPGEAEQAEPVALADAAIEAAITAWFGEYQLDYFDSEELWDRMRAAIKAANDFKEAT